VRWLAFALGLWLVAFSASNLVFALVLPRPTRQRLVQLVTRSVRLAFVGVARLARSYETKDRLLGPVGPVALLVQLAVFLGLFVVGYGLSLTPWSGSPGLGLRQAGASLFSVGLAHVPGPTNEVLVSFVAATGAITIALQIAYLPAIYSSFNRREALVTMLESRAGSPAWGPEILLRHQLVGITDALAGFYASWERWSAELSESHTTYPVLLLFRSPDPWFSWVTSLIAVLDAAAMHLALCPDTAPSEARLCLRMGFSALRRIGTTLGWGYEADPLPDSPIDVSEADFAEAVSQLVAVGFPVQRPASEAWPHFRGWRVNYESLAYRAADRFVAPPSPWSGPRRHLRTLEVSPYRPPHRSPGGRLVQQDHLYPRPSAGVPQRPPEAE
jgi:hypothetical protein